MSDKAPTPRLPSGEPNPYPAEDGSCSWCDGKDEHDKECPLRTKEQR